VPDVAVSHVAHLATCDYHASKVSRAETDASGDDSEPVETLPVADSPPLGTVLRFRLSVIEGPDRGRHRESRSGRCTIGSHRLNDLVIKDPTVSRFHCEVLVDGPRLRVRDLGSRNGTIADGVSVVEAFLRQGSTLRLGNVLVGLEVGDRPQRLRLADRTEFGGLLGQSTAMRACFALMERAAETDVTLIVEGETGTGKSAAAEAIHRASRRKRRPFVVVDCGAIPSTLLESELFGHEKGAFTGATERRRGAFEEADGGTLLLDEIGELTPDLQPKLLRVLEHRQIRRVGSNAFLPVDVRLIAATNRDLRAEVNAGRFRSDLFFRLAVVRLEVPPLRRRPDDIPLLIERLLHAGGHDGPEAQALREPGRLAELQRAAWPGNVRELRNYIERTLFYSDGIPPPDEPVSPRAIDIDTPFSEARKQALEGFERDYLGKLLRRHEGRMQDTADAAGIHRIHLYKMLRKLGMR
jgi:two-component system, NtrC family, response regulator GlrR